MSFLSKKKMFVGELKRRLAKLNDDTLVVVENHHSEYKTIVGFELHEIRNEVTLVLKEEY